jgi:hypothetical protein
VVKDDACGNEEEQMPFTDEQRAEILQQGRDTLERLATFQPDDLAWAMAQPVPDPIDKWRREAQQRQDERERARIETEQHSLEARLTRYIDQSITGALNILRSELSTAIADEHSLMIEICGRALGEYGDQLKSEMTKAKTVVPLRSHGSKQDSA